MVRHGASIWNLANIFTGWTDVELSEQGKQEAHIAGKKLNNFKFDLAFTSKLKRAIDTLSIILEEIKQTNIPIVEDQALNERHYGNLQGKNKNNTKKEFGEEQVHLWRRSFDIAPPNGESLRDTFERTVPYLKSKILPEIKRGKDIIISAHGNSLRSILMELENISPKDIPHVNIPTGVPYVFEFDENMKVAKKTILDGSDEQSDKTRAIQ